MSKEQYTPGTKFLVSADNTLPMSPSFKGTICTYDGDSFIMHNGKRQWNTLFRNLKKLPIQVGDTVRYKNVYNQELHGGDLEVLDITSTSLDGVHVKQIGGENWDFYISLDTAELVKKKEENMTAFKKGDRVQYTNSFGETRYGIFDRLQDSYMAYAFWGNTLAEAENTTYATWVDVKEVIRCTKFKDGDIINDGDPWDTWYYKVLATTKYGYVVSRGSNSIEKAQESNEASEDFFLFDSVSNFSLTKTEDEPETTELTLKEVADKLAIPVEQLRIKD